MKRAAFVSWSNDAPTGGNVYNGHLVRATWPLGLELELCRLSGSWPPGDDEDHQRLTQLLLAEPVSLVDGIVASGAPDSVAAAVQAGRVVVVLVHLPIVDEVGISAVLRADFARREGAALHAASGVLCASAWAAARVFELYGLSDVAVARPGVESAGVALGSAGSGVPRLLCLASVTPTKNQLTLARALDQVRDLPWTARFVGSAEADPHYAAEVRGEVAALGLADRVGITGALVGDDLDQQWDAADLLLLPSRVDMYPLVVGEALARGIPAIVGSNTGAVEALQAGSGGAEGLQPDLRRPGCSVDTQTPGELAGVLRDWLTGPALRKEWRDVALTRRQRLPRWGQTAADVLRYLRSLSLSKGCFDPSTSSGQAKLS